MKKILSTLMIAGLVFCSSCSWSTGDDHDDSDSQNNSQPEKKQEEKETQEEKQKEIEYGYVNMKYVSFMSKSKTTPRIEGFFIANSARIIICKADEDSSILVDETNTLDIETENSTKGVFDARYKLPVGKYIAKIDIFNDKLSSIKALLHGESPVFEVVKGENTLPNILCKPCECENLIFDEEIEEIRVKPNTERWFSYTAETAGKVKITFNSPNPWDLNFFYVIYDEDGKFIRNKEVNLKKEKRYTFTIEVPAKKIYIGMGDPSSVRSSTMYYVTISKVE